MSIPLHYRDLADVAAGLASGALSSVEATRHALARIEALEPKLHAFAEVRAEAAMREAVAADERRARGERFGLLHGVPVAVKDLCAMSGTQTRAGGFFPTGFKDDETATVVAQLQAAGAVVVGKTQLTEGAWGTHHPDIPPPVNPWAPDFWSGASSSGSGVSVAAGLAYGAIGTDTAGSIRFPSACNHLVGLKPTWGRVSRRGVFPLSDTLDHVGPMARSVLDVALMFAAIAGADPLDPTTRDEPVDDYVAAARAGTLKGVRIGIDPDYALGGGNDPPTAAAMNGAIAALKACGAELADVRLSGIDAILERAVASAFVEAAVAHAAIYPLHKARYSRTFAGLLDLGHAAKATDYAEVAIWRREFKGQLARLFRSVDLMLAPVAMFAPPPIAAMQATADAPLLAAAPFMRFTIPFNLAGVPTLTMPMGLTDQGVPLGFQLIGPELGEAKLLAAGAAFERHTRFADRHPDV